ncbi:MAG: hypothetical protein H0U66_02000 [Gemmatimonadaceae bacterium]|nr:hypothetical protein [Gemmatimonadaceae bacterium]
MKPPRRVWVLVSAGEHPSDVNGGLAVFATKPDAEAYRRDENERFCGDFLPPVAYALVEP